MGDWGGGTNLILYYLGMVIEKHGIFRDISVKKSILTLFISSAIWFLFWRFVRVNGRILDQYFPYAGGLNPPSATLFIFSLCMLGMTFGFFTFADRFRYAKWSVEIAGWIGKRTMAIFFYHMLVVEWIRPRYKAYCSNEQTWGARILYFAVMIGGSILIDAVVTYFQKNLKRVVTL